MSWGSDLLVIGDTILDSYIEGSVERISPEAPVPILQKESEKLILGGAANVAANLIALTKKVVQVDYFGFSSLKTTKMLTTQAINFIGVPVAEKDILKKTRFVSNTHQLLRLDDNLRYSKEQELVLSQLIKKIEHNLSSYKMILISDYNKGTLTEEIFRYVTDNFNGPIVVDLKIFRNWITDLNLDNCIFKCNQKEFEKNRIHILEYSKLKNLVVTKGKYGYSILYPSLTGSEKTIERPAIKLGGNVDPVGAGDTFFAGMAAYFMNEENLDIEAMTAFGNKAAAARVSKFGKLIVSHKEVE